MAITKQVKAVCNKSETGNSPVMKPLGYVFKDPKQMPGT